MHKKYRQTHITNENVSTAQHAAYSFERNKLAHNLLPENVRCATQILIDVQMHCPIEMNGVCPLVEGQT